MTELWTRKCEKLDCNTFIFTAKHIHVLMFAFIWNVYAYIRSHTSVHPTHLVFFYFLFKNTLFLINIHNVANVYCWIDALGLWCSGMKIRVHTISIIFYSHYKIFWMVFFTGLEGFRRNNSTRCRIWQGWQNLEKGTDNDSLNTRKDSSKWAINPSFNRTLTSHEKSSANDVLFKDLYKHM